MMNKAAIGLTSKRHTTTDESTTASEITEAYLLACDVEGFRNLNEEIGLKQMEPTVLLAGQPICYPYRDESRILGEED
jgi:hypothetical protein